MVAKREFTGTADAPMARQTAGWRLAWRYLSLVLFSDSHPTVVSAPLATAPPRRGKASGGRQHIRTAKAAIAPSASQIRAARNRPLANNSRDIERQYLDEVFSLPRMGAADELMLARRMKAGDRAAFDTLITSNLGLVVLIARRFRRSGVPLLDLIAEGNFGLMGAAKGFDPERGYRFSTYAKWSVMHAIQAALPGLVGVVKLPAARRQPSAAQSPEELPNCAHQVTEAAGAQENSSADLTEEFDSSCADRIALPPATPHDLGRSPYTDQVADESIFDGLAIPEHEHPPESMMARQRTDLLNRALTLLPERDRIIIVSRYALESDQACTLAELSRELGMSVERVRQLEAAALQKLSRGMARAGVRSHALI